jgi:ABC-type amino acid transport substrate-binding protein
MDKCYNVEEGRKWRDTRTNLNQAALVTMQRISAQKECIWPKRKWGWEDNFPLPHYETKGGYIVIKRHLIIGADPFPPYQYYDENGILQGTDYERIKNAGIKVGFELEFVIEDWASVEQKFSENRLDAVFQLPKTPEREKQYLFSKLLRNGATEVVTGNPNIEITSINDIDAKKLTLGVVDGISYGGGVDSLNQKRKVSYQNNENLLLAISKCEVDFGIFDQGVKQFLMEKLFLENIRAIDALTFIRPLFMAFHEKEIKEEFDTYL